VGWVTKIGSAEMVGIGCDEYRAILWKLTKVGDRGGLTAWERRVLNKAKEQNW
jgi:hypothetical protein